MTAIGGEAPKQNLREAALWYAAIRSVPVFPCKPGDKPPLTRHGHLDASTDLAKIEAWWERWPLANIGIPTGEASGLVVVDLDVYKASAWAPEEVEGALGPLPATTAVRTGRGGLHFFYRLPEGELRNGILEDELGPGVCVKASGGYVLAPPSVTEGLYVVLNDAPVAECPAWLAEALRRPPGGLTGYAGERSGSVIVDVAGPPIPERTRNNTLFKIGSKLRAYGADEGAILDALTKINATRCSSPIGKAEIKRITHSTTRYAPGNASLGPDARTLAAIDAIEADLTHAPLRGTAGHTDLDTMSALVALAREHGRLLPCGGVRVSVSYRHLALAASTHKSTLQESVKRLKRAGRLRSDNAERRAQDSGAFVLMPPRAERVHSATQGGAIEPRGVSVPASRAPRLRWSGPQTARLGKANAHAIDFLVRAGGIATIEEIAATVGVKRQRDFRRRNITRLEAAGVVECRGDRVLLTPDWAAALERERERGGEMDAERMNRARYAREREAFARRGEVRPERPVDASPPTPWSFALFSEVHERTAGRTTRTPPDHRRSGFRGGAHGLVKGRERAERCLEFRGELGRGFNIVCRWYHPPRSRRREIER